MTDLHQAMLKNEAACVEWNRAAQAVKDGKTYTNAIGNAACRDEQYAPTAINRLKHIAKSYGNSISIAADTAAQNISSIGLKHTSQTLACLAALIEFPKADNIHYSQEIQEAAQNLAKSLMSSANIIPFILTAPEEQKDAFCNNLERIDKSGLLHNSDFNLKDTFDGMVQISEKVEAGQKELMSPGAPIAQTSQPA